MSIPYKPVVILHGVNDSPRSVEFMADRIRQVHPRTRVILPTCSSGAASLLPLWRQVDRLREELHRIRLDDCDSFHLVGYSQGGLVGRGYLETTADHRVDSFVSLAAPQMGQYGETALENIPLYKRIITHMHYLLYTKLGQLISLGSYWRDPYHLVEYRRRNNFLPILNNEVEHPRMEDFKKNFSQLRHLVLLGGPRDTVITPWQSCHFGFYNERGQISDMRDQKFYQQDAFGLRTLDERGALVSCTLPEGDHKEYPLNAAIIDQYVLPWLT